MRLCLESVGLSVVVMAGTVVVVGTVTGGFVDVISSVLPRRRLTAVFIKGYFPSEHKPPVKSSRSGAQNMIPANPISLAYLTYERKKQRKRLFDPLYQCQGTFRLSE